MLCMWCSRCCLAVYIGCRATSLLLQAAATAYPFCGTAGVGLKGVPLHSGSTRTVGLVLVVVLVLVCVPSTPTAGVVFRSSRCQGHVPSHTKHNCDLHACSFLSAASFFPMLPRSPVTCSLLTLTSHHGMWELRLGVVFVWVLFYRRCVVGRGMHACRDTRAVCCKKGACSATPSSAV